MSKIWFYLAKRFNPEAEITVYHGDHVDEIRKFGNKFPGVSFVKLDMEGILPHTITRGRTAPSQDLILSMWRLFERQQYTPKHLFVEADAWILAPLNDWWRAADDKPYIATLERVTRDNFRLINTGTHSCNSLNFVTYSKLLHEYQKRGFIEVPVGEQGLINLYFESIGYDCMHPSIGFEYNCYAAGSVIKKLDDKEIIIHSGNMPTTRKARQLKARNLGWKWWGLDRRVKVLHAYYIKWWNLPECQPLWDYCISKVHEMER
jgi:hypothetical protein